MPGTEEITDVLMDDVFSAAFDEEVAGGEKKVEDPPEDAAQKKAEEEAAAAKVADEAKAAEEAAAKASEETKESPELLALKAEIEDTKRLLREKAEAEAAAKKAAEAKAAEPTPEELEAEKKFKEDWPDHATRMERQSAELSTLKKELAELKEMVSSVGSTVAETEQDKYMKPILEAHPDAVKLHESGDLNKWIAKQPRYLQAGYLFALQSDQATPQDVIEVFNIYKESSGLVKKDADPEAAQKAAAAKAAEEARLKKMEIPDGSRTSLTAEPDPDDFDSAFEQELKKYK